MSIDFQAANLLIVENIETILDYFDVEYSHGRNRITLPCPIHSSDNYASMCIYTDGETAIGNYVCWTGHCEQEIGNGVINIVKYLLDEKTKKHNSYEDINVLVKSLTGSEFGKISVEQQERKKFSRLIREEKSSIEPTITRTQVRINLKIPSDYYLDRGFSKEILSRYDIGFSFKKNDELFMRTVVPVYNDEFKLIGRLGRSIFNECPICSKFHDKNRMCPTNSIEQIWAAKWRNSQGFNTGDYFYNLWYAKEHIQKSQSVVLVEGCGDVLRLEEAGIKIGLGLFGLELTEKKLEILNRLGIMDIYLALDSDSAGQNATEKIYNRIRNYFNVNIVKIGKKDIGDTSINEVQDMFRNFVRK